MALKPVPHAVPDLRGLVTRLSSEVAARLTRALDHLGELADSGRPDGQLLQSVGDEIARARRVGIVGQQIVRLASGAVHPETESVLACELLRSLVAQRCMAKPDSVEFHTDLPRARIECDASLLGALLQSMLDWCAEHTDAPTRLCLTTADLGVGLAVKAWITLDHTDVPESLDSLNWHLLFFTSQALGVRVQRQQTADLVSLTLQLQTARRPVVTDTLPVLDVPVQAGQVLVVAPERDLRNQVRLAIRGLDLLVDYVGSLDAAERHCKDSVPKAVIYDGALDAQRIEALRSSLQSDEPGLPFIEIAKQGQGGLALPCVPRLGIEGLMASLPSTLATELARGR
jgi:hypothetical protein